MRLVTLEEHFTTQEFEDALGPAVQLVSRNGDIRDRLLDLGPSRIQSMDLAGVDYQILSFTGFGLYSMPFETAATLSRNANIHASEAMKCWPNRLGAFASLPMQKPEAAAAELAYCVNHLGFVGATVDGIVGGKFLDNEEFNPLFEAAVELDVPIYLHPAPPPSMVRRSYTDDVEPPFNYLLSTSAWGWHCETGLHVLRMMIGKVFDRFPKLKIILGHLGENLPYSIARADSVLIKGGLRLDRAPLEVFKENCWLTTSGYFTIPPLKCAIETIGIERIMLSIDYPFCELASGRKLLEDLRATCSTEEIKLMAETNATELFGLDFSHGNL
jgi:predicted TIM-barrel fold metal-dependent hydrolase